MDRSRRGGMKGRWGFVERIQEKFKTAWDVGKPRKSGEIRISPYIYRPPPLTPIHLRGEYGLREFVRTHIILTPGACGR